MYPTEPVYLAQPGYSAQSEHPAPPVYTAQHGYSPAPEYTPPPDYFSLYPVEQQPQQETIIVSRYFDFHFSAPKYPK